MKKLMLLAFILHATSYAHPQGCMAVRSVTTFSSGLLLESTEPTDKWFFNFTNRYFEATDTYRGKQYVTDSLVVNRLYTFNITAIRLLDEGWSLALQVPISANARRNSKDHGGPPTTPRHTTHAYGLGDIRLTAYKWLWDPAIQRNGNIQAGLGIKFPTGDFRYQDYFFRNDSTKVLAPVDQAIQLGDGGTGLIGELNGFYSFNKTISVFATAYYLANPREQNGVSNLKGIPPTRDEIKSGAVEMSVPDQYTLRGGANIHLRDFILTTSLRYERVPAEDLLGGSSGFRRAGSITSVEPGITYKMKKLMPYVFVTLPIDRRLIQSVPDKVYSDLKDRYSITPGAFADLIVYFGVSFSL